MSQLLTTTLLITSFLATATLPNGAFAKETRMRHADLNVALPDTPQKSVVDLGDGLRQNRLIVNQSNGSIIVWHQESNPGVTDRKAILQKAQETIVGIAKGTVSKEKDVELQGNPGRMFTVSIPSNNGEFRVAYFYSSGKNYQVMAVGTKDFTRSAAIDKMFSTLEFQTN